MIDKHELNRLIKLTGLDIKVYNPHDGLIRYRIYAHPVMDYFESYGLYTALSMSEAIAYLNGYLAGLDNHN